MNYTYEIIGYKHDDVMLCVECENTVVEFFYSKQSQPVFTYDYEGQPWECDNCGIPIK